MSKEAQLASLSAERSRQYNLPGSEWDVRNSPNDWVAIADHYLAKCVRRGANLPDQEEFQDSLIKAGAVILAALEHIPVMATNGQFQKP